MYVYICMCQYVYVYMNTYIYSITHARTHTYTHTRIHRPPCPKALMMMTRLTPPPKKGTVWATADSAGSEFAQLYKDRVIHGPHHPKIPVDMVRPRAHDIHVVYLTQIPNSHYPGTFTTWSHIYLSHYYYY